jgi:hypothetical protein
VFPEQTVLKYMNPTITRQVQELTNFAERIEAEAAASPVAATRGKQELIPASAKQPSGSPAVNSSAAVVPVAPLVP